MERVQIGRPCRGVGADTIRVDTEGDDFIIAHVVERWRSAIGSHCIMWESKEGAVFIGRFAPERKSTLGRGVVTWA